MDEATPPSNADGVFKSLPYYNCDVEFRHLSKEDPKFAAALRAASKDGFIDFQDETFVQYVTQYHLSKTANHLTYHRQLAKTILKVDFNLTLTLPPDRLCPAVPVRWNYVRWLQDLLDTSAPWTDLTAISLAPVPVPDPARRVRGLDIGVGASCIYGLLACATRPRWEVCGTDIDAASLAAAQANVTANGLVDRILLRRQPDPTAALVPFDLLPWPATPADPLDFVMTNPPFYASAEDMAACNARKPRPASAVCTGAENEMIGPGGDLGFARRLLAESRTEGPRVRWWTIMLGKRASAVALVAELRAAGVSNFAVTDLRAGHRTRRWAVAWSWTEFRPSPAVARHGEDLGAALLPPGAAQTIATPMQDAKWAGRIVDETLRGLDVEWLWRPLLAAGVMACSGDVWSRSARRKRERQQVQQQETSTSADGAQSARVPAEAEPPNAIALAVTITCKEEQVEVVWIRGHERLLFESFCGKLKRALTGRG